MNVYEVQQDNPSVTNLIISGNKHNGIILVDTEDVDRLKRYQWYIKDKLKENHRHYVAAKMGTRTVKLHRYLMGEPEGMVVDHRNRDTFDNRKTNLRVTSSSANNLNTAKRCTNQSGRTGVYFKEGQVASSGRKRSDSWVAQARVNNQTQSKQFAVSVYGHDGARAAAEAWRAALEQEHGILTEQ